ncbi:hypothetical protein M2263_004619 [Providencia alcalifaciens]|nr:hypothetical protein [Providencia alcalifaciens]
MYITKYDQLMNKGKELEAKKLYRRAIEIYNQAFFIAEPPLIGAISQRQLDSKIAAARCLSKVKIKITESYL